MKIVKNFILLVVSVFSSIMCLGGMFFLVVLIQDSEFQKGKVAIIIISLLMIMGFGLITCKCCKTVFYRKKIKQSRDMVENSITKTPEQSVEKTITPAIADVPLQQKQEIPNINAQHEIPQETLNDMRMVYTAQQAIDDMRIIDESLVIMEKTSDIDTFLSRYETAMRCALTLEQAKKAGIQIALADDFSGHLADLKSKELSAVLYRSLKKELNEINNLKTEKGKLNRINKYQEKLKQMYEDVFEFVAEDAYNDVIQKLEFLKNENNA